MSRPNPDPPGDGRERALFLLALADLSHRCETPHLTPDCPFYEPTEQGPQCAEECMDLLAGHGGPACDTRVTHLADGYEIHKRAVRPRRDAAEPGPAFDAAQVQMIDQDKVTRDKRTVALVRDLRGILLDHADWSGDHDDRVYLSGAYWDELARRGVPVEDLVRLAFAPGLAIAVLSNVFEPDHSSPHAHTFDRNGWTQALAGIGIDTDGNTAGSGLLAVPADRLLEAVTHIASYFKAADRATIVQLSPPADRVLPAMRYDREAVERLMVAQWVHDRFAQTYVDHWVPSSRALEWRYLHGKQPGCCPPEVMRERYVDADQLSNHLADLGADDVLADVPGEDPTPTMSTTQFAAVAASHLREGKYDTAASLFRAILQLEPNDALAHNNLGFCLLPTDPATALEHLRTADRLIGKFDATSTANTVLALHLLGRDSEALTMADAAAARFSSADPMAWLWDHDCGRPLMLTDGSVPVDVYTAALREHIATAGPSDDR